MTFALLHYHHRGALQSKQQNMHDTEYCVMTIIVNKGTKKGTPKQNKKEQKTKKVCKKNVKKKFYESVAPYEYLNK